MRAARSSARTAERRGGRGIRAADPKEVRASHCSTLLATLSGPALNGAVPTGRGDWRGTPQSTGVELKVEIRNVNLPDGTRLTLETCGLQAPMTLSSREARFELRSSVPIHL